MAMLSMVQLFDAAGVVREATAFARHDGKLLDPGLFSVQYEDARRVVAVEDMPQHWQDQLEGWGMFARSKAMRDFDAAVPAPGGEEPPP